MTTCFGVLLEAVSIQKFIFQSNKLKTNLGASHLVQHEIFDKYLKKAVLQVFGQQFDFSWEVWQEFPSEIRIINEAFEIGYIGGGNALLLFQDKIKAEEVIKAWTRILLINTPGLITATAIGALTLDSRFRETLDSLFKTLRMNKAQYIPQTTIPRHGITSECSQSGLSAEYWWKDKGEYVSSVIGAKLGAAKSARNYFQGLFKEHLNEDFCLPDEFDKLGSISGDDSHIAVVHIDGNRMAQRFKVDSLEAIRNLSVSVHNATLTAFTELVGYVVSNYKTIMIDLGFDPQIKDDRYWYPMDNEYNIKCLPLTPLVLGGDDVTFVCDGKLGIYFAKVFIEAFEKKQVSDKKKLTACAGIAVIKAKYPFYRGYQLAEDLCSSAKKEFNKDEEDPDKLISALDFHISMSGIAGSLKQVRDAQFISPGGRLSYRPYKLGQVDKDEQCLNQMLKLAAELEKFPKNKIKELQGVLSLSKDACMQFVEETKFRGRKLPELPGRNYSSALFDNKKTIYFDMIELLEFYPKFALRQEDSNENI